MIDIMLSSLISSEGFLIFAICAIVLYFVPWMIGNSKQRKDICCLFFFNLNFAWTGIGWIIALIWAFSTEKDKKHRS